MVTLLMEDWNVKGEIWWLCRWSVASSGYQGLYTICLFECSVCDSGGRSGAMTIPHYEPQLLGRGNIDVPYSIAIRWLPAFHYAPQVFSCDGRRIPMRLSTSDTEPD